jgi:hypothetical protein
MPFRLYFGHSAAREASPDVAAFPVGVEAVGSIGDVAAAGVHTLLHSGWNSLPTGVLFTNNDTVATAKEEQYNQEILSVMAHRVSKRYVEVTYNGGESLGFYDDNRYWALLDSDGQVDTDSTGDVQIFPPLVLGDVIGMAVNLDLGKVWFRVNGGPWNNDPTQGPY